jgi:hypothetical protein
MERQQTKSGDGGIKMCEKRTAVSLQRQAHQLPNADAFAPERLGGSLQGQPVFSYVDFSKPDAISEFPGMQRRMAAQSHTGFPVAGESANYIPASSPGMASKRLCLEAGSCSLGRGIFSAFTWDSLPWLC